MQPRVAFFILFPTDDRLCAGQRFGECTAAFDLDLRVADGIMKMIQVQDSITRRKSNRSAAFFRRVRAKSALASCAEMVYNTMLYSYILSFYTLMQKENRFELVRFRKKRRSALGNGAAK